MSTLTVVIGGKVVPERDLLVFDILAMTVFPQPVRFLSLRLG
jgi:hypothetical protein